MTITIPVWILWTLGSAAGIVILALSAFGAIMLYGICRYFK